MHTIVEEGCFIAETSVISGAVVVKRGASIWYNAVIRGDVEKVIIGEGTSIQDNCVVHVDEGYPVIIGKNVTIGHGAIIHGAKIGDETIVGINAVVLNGAEVGRGCIIGANACVTPSTKIPNYSLVVGVPAKVIKTDESLVKVTRKNAESYHKLRDEYLNKKYKVIIGGR